MCYLHLFFAVALYFATVDGKVIQTNDYVRYAEARVWLKLHRSPAAWRDARLTCFLEGATLASPENEVMLSVMNDMMSWSCGISHIFTGIYDVLSMGALVSIEGIPLKDMPVSFAPTRPKFGNNRICLSMHHQGMLADNDCSDKLPYICYKKDPEPAPSCGSEDNGYSLNKTTGSCYKFHKESKYWNEAYIACYNEDAHLAIINSDYEAEVLKDLFVSNVKNRNQDYSLVRDVVHIGFGHWGREDGQYDPRLWMTIHGQTLKDAGYDKWNEGEPNNNIRQLCGGMYDNGKLDDVSCTNGDPGEITRYFICEKKPEYTNTALLSDNLN